MNAPGCGTSHRSWFKNTCIPDEKGITEKDDTKGY